MAEHQVMNVMEEEQFSEEEFEKRAASLSKKTLRELYDLWSEMYRLPPSMKIQRGKQFIKHLAEFYGDMVRCEVNKKASLEKDIALKHKLINELSKELRITISTEMPPDSSLKTYAEELDSIFKKHQEVKDNRMNRLQSLRNEEKRLCGQLEVNCLQLVVVGVPTEEQLEMLELNIFELREEKVRRIDEYKVKKARIIKLLQDLELHPRNSFEMELINSTPDTFKFAPDNMALIKESLHSIEEAYKASKDMCQDLWSQVENIWSRINEDETQCARFKDRHTGVGPTTISAINTELERCYEVRRSNLETLIHQVKDSIEDIWNMMTYTDDQKQYLQPFFVNKCTEDILDLLELENQKLREHYAANTEIYRLAAKRQELWDRMIHLDHLAQDKNRLFNNRGGQLLKEEKERKTIDVNLPKIDKQLQQHIMNYQKKYNTPFFWYGRNLLDKILTDWEEQNMLKKTKQQIRKAEHAKAVEMEARLGTQVSATKRKMAGGHDITTGKQMKMNGDGLKPTSAGSTTSTTPVNDRTVFLAQGKWRKGRLAEPRTPIGTTPSQSSERSLASESMESIASYTYFKDEINDKPDNGDWPATSERQVLREINGANATTPRSQLASKEDALPKTPKSARKPPVRTPGGITPTSRLVSTPRSASKRAIATPRLLSTRACFNLKL